MSEKQCTKCGEVKPFSDYYKMTSGKFGLQAECKSCISTRRLKYRLQRRKELIEAAKLYRASNSEKISERRKEHYKANREVVIQRNTEYAKKNKTSRNKRIQQRRIECPAYRLECNLRGRVRKLVSGANKSSSTMKMLGCSIDALRKHLEAQFADGMNWDNYGYHGWHVDHIRPCASFDLLDQEEQRQCFHYTNLQPLWAKDNMRKSDKIL